MTTSTATLAVDAHDLHKSFKRGKQPIVQAVDGLSLSVTAGQIVAFLGPNGAGKTTTIDMLLGLTEPDSGSVSIAGLAPRQAVLGGKVSAVLQTGGLLADLTVVETVRLIASMIENPRPVSEVMDRAGIAGLASRRVSKCSGGEQQRLRFALALLPDPELLILDEPTAGMDVSARRAFWDTMRADTKAGRAVLFATHYLEEADAFAERIVMVSAGRIVADGTAREIRAMGSQRSISVDLPHEGVDDWLSRVRAIPGAAELEISGSRATFTAADTDVAALMLLRDLDGRNVEIIPASLDAAFMRLTGDSAEAEVTA